jgi:hypothetical protein
MLKGLHPARGSRPLPWWWFALGFVVAGALLAGLAEAFLRLFPPKDLHAYLGEASPLAGIYLPDADFGVTYRSWEAFRADNAERLGPFLPGGSTTEERPIWAFFGNSFVQAPGMLADTARAAIHDHRIFNLGRNELLFVRLAQIKMLLAGGMRPERIFVELMPVDVLELGSQPLASFRVTGKGALTYEPRFPAGPLAWLVKHSRLAFTAWVRAGQHHANPRFNKRTLYEGLEEPLHGDLERLFGNLARLSHEYQVPVTVLLIPAYHQITQGASFGFQDTLAPMLRRQGYDVFDPREAFCRHAEPESLFLPDKHFNEAGNQRLLAELRQHLRDFARKP